MKKEFCSIFPPMKEKKKFFCQSEHSARIIHGGFRPLWKIGLFWQKRFMTCSAWMSQATLRDMIKYLNSELLNLLLNYKLDIYVAIYSYVVILMLIRLWNRLEVSWISPSVSIEERLVFFVLFWITMSASHIHFNLNTRCRFLSKREQR